MQASRRQDKPAKELLSKIFKIPKETQEAVLCAFVERCQHLHVIAFQQWRLRHPPAFDEKHDRDDAIELCEKMIKRYLDTVM